MKHKITGDFTSWNWSIYEFNQKMRNVAEDEEVILEMNSYGGDVFMGIDLCNTLRAHPGKVTAIVTGIAASAASIAIMGADIIKAYSNTQIMVHHAWTVVAGNSKELRKAADDLESIGESVLASYTKRVDADTMKQLLDSETFLSAVKAKEMGLIDELVDSEVAEPVESEMFQDKVKAFNDLIKANQSKKTAALGDQSKGPDPSELENLIKTMIEKQLDDAPKGDPTPPEPKQTVLHKALLHL